MRLIHAETLALHEFTGEGFTPKYAILSHTWGEQELSYLDLLYLTSDIPAGAATIVQTLLRNPSRDTTGFIKVEACCGLARSRGLDWVWIDTCCIDKSSSAELSEAINSMWSWYRNAAECYVYLSYLPFNPVQLQNNREALEAFRRARWFSRGWTLQELLAPKRVFFCNANWEVFAEKSQIAIELSNITRIPSIFLDGTYDPSDHKSCSVAMKMSWLSCRQTTRTEDMAYCMLGLFDVHMPLIYGEGRKAFMRLQLEIIKKIDDDSIYAWASETGSSGLLASWPTAFAESGNIVQLSFPDDHTPWLPPEMTSLGLELKARYERHDANQQKIDAQYNAQTLSTALPLSSDIRHVVTMHCGPCDVHSIPITHYRKQHEPCKALLIILQQFGAIWRRVNCTNLEFEDYSPDAPRGPIAYMIYYVEQPGL